jgi:PHD/YefM family antitoxin component YafN of YafNO toxin-antitoxin module
MSIKNTVTVSELKTIDIIKKMKELNEPITVISKSKPRAVLMSLDAYALMKIQQERELDLTPHK